MHANRVVRDEEGTALIMVTMLLVVLLGFAAIAIDGAAAWALKRQDQSGADTGAIAGAMHTAGRSSDDAMSDAEDEIIRITYSTMTPDMTPDEWAAEWASCIDRDKPAAFTQTLNSDCISFTSNLSRIRVRTPVIPWETTFGKVIGFDRIDTDAVAEVSTALAANGGVLPFGMPGGSKTATEVCLKTGANPKNTAPSDGPDEGNFGFLDFTQYGNDELGTTTLCNGGGTDRIERNIAQGIDHNLGSTTNPYATSHTEVDGCLDGNVNYQPYHVTTETGNMARSSTMDLSTVSMVSTAGWPVAATASACAAICSMTHRCGTTSTTPVARCADGRSATTTPSTPALRPTIREAPGLVARFSTPA